MKFPIDLHDLSLKFESCKFEMQVRSSTGKEIQMIFNAAKTNNRS